VAGESQLVGYPTQFPSVSMLDWNTGQPNARYWVLKLIHESLGPGDKLVDTNSSVGYVYAQAFIARDGAHKILLVNKRNRRFDISIPGGEAASVRYVDPSTGSQPPVTSALSGEGLSLQGFGVAIVTLAK
jgi:hypothetical protein